MTTTTRRALLWALNTLGGFVGVWALFFPSGFYDAFPGFGLHWISIDGPYNEHLIRDVGELYLALTAGGIVAALAKGPSAGRALAVAWIVFSVPHLMYHLEHLRGLAPVDAIGEPVSLALSLLLALPLLAPTPRPTTTPKETHA